MPCCSLDPNETCHLQDHDSSFKFVHSSNHGYPYCTALPLGLADYSLHTRHTIFLQAPLLCSVLSQLRTPLAVQCNCLQPCALTLTSSKTLLGGGHNKIFTAPPPTLSSWSLFLAGKVCARSVSHASGGQLIFLTCPRN